MSLKPVMLTTDFLIFLLIVVVLIFAFWARKKEHLRVPWRQVFKNKLAIVALTVLMTYVVIGVLDCIHFRVNDSTQVKSVLDVLLSPLNTHDEKSYSAPFSTHGFVKESIEIAADKYIRAYPNLIYAGEDLKKLGRTQALDIVLRSIHGLIYAMLITLGVTFFISLFKPIQSQLPFLITLLVMLSFVFVSYELSREYHIFGTDKVGQDVFYIAVKSIRTGLMIGTLTTLVMLPFAILLGMMAGYFGGVTDDIIQYIYTTLSSIPGVLLIAASILSLQIFMSTHSDLFPTLTQRADIRLLALCIILGVTSWTSLCRLLRGESLKIREMDYVQAATALGVNHFTILMRHVLPNVMHIIIISVVLDFSGLVLAEAVLSYVGVGVDPTTLSWGNMINSARLELAREPVVWWPLLAAFVLMFVFVLSANLFSDAVRDAFDPRLREH